MYVVGRLELPGKNLPLFVHSLAVLDAFQLRKCFHNWRSYAAMVRRLLQRPLNRVFQAWKKWTSRRAFCLAAAVVLAHKRDFCAISAHFWKWKVGLKLLRSYPCLETLRCRQALRYWARKTALNRASRQAYQAINPVVSFRSTEFAFGAWMTVWLQRVRLQRVSNRVVCNRFDRLQRSAWATWRGLYKVIKAYRQCNKGRLHEAANTIKGKIREKQYLVDREEKRKHFRRWILLYSYHVRGGHILSTWHSFHRRRKLQRALRHWILLFSVETITICVQKSWRGYFIRFVKRPETWIRVRW